MKKTLILLPVLAGIIAGFSIYTPPTHIATHPPSDETNVIYFINKDVKSPILVMNNTGLTLKAHAKLGVHLALIPYKDKHIPMAYDLVPWEDHENAEHYVMKFAKQNGKPKLPIEQYSQEFILSVKNYCATDSKLQNAEREKILLVIHQTLEYMKTEYFAKIYKDGNRVKEPQEVADWITENTVVPSEFVLGEMSEQTIQLKND